MLVQPIGPAALRGVQSVPWLWTTPTIRQLKAITHSAVGGGILIYVYLACSVCGTVKEGKRHSVTDRQVGEGRTKREMGTSVKLGANLHQQKGIEGETGAGVGQEEARRRTTTAALIFAVGRTS